MRAWPGERRSPIGERRFFCAAWPEMMVAAGNSHGVQGKMEAVTKRGAHCAPRMGGF